MPNESKPIRSARGEEKKIEVYYDGVCNLCAGFAEKIDLSKRGGAFALKDAHTNSLPEGVSKKQVMRDMYVVDEKGDLHKGWRAVTRIMKEYPHLRWLAALAEIPPLNIIAAILYRIVEKTRYWIFGRKH